MNYTELYKGEPKIVWLSGTHMINNPCEMDLLIKLLHSGDSKNENNNSNNIIPESRAKEINESYQNLCHTANSSNVDSGIEE